MDVDDVADFLDELVALGLVYEENGRYLSLALPIAPRGSSDAELLRPGRRAFTIHASVAMIALATAPPAVKFPSSSNRPALAESAAAPDDAGNAAGRPARRTPGSGPE